MSFIPPIVNRYVAGFMFDFSRSSVALIRKTHPEWQRGLLNGIGGRIQPGESQNEAMTREFNEEAGTWVDNWLHFLCMEGSNDNGECFVVDFYAAMGDVHQLRSMEEEKVEIIEVNSVHPGRRDVVENLTWLIPLALDSMLDGRPSFTITRYELTTQ